jgi:hypothetical protein
MSATASTSPQALEHVRESIDYGFEQRDQSGVAVVQPRLTGLRAAETC